jgi:hypothetical protein
MAEENRPSEPLVLPYVKEPKRITETLLCRKCIQRFGPDVREVVKRQHVEAGFLGNRQGIQVWCILHDECMAIVEVEGAPPLVKSEDAQ